MSPDPYPKSYLYKRVVQAKLFIDEHYAESLNLNNISDEANFSKYHFIRLFRIAYGKTPHQYLTRVRIEKAMEVLKAGGTVSDACFTVGFESLGSFSRLFKRTVGITPSEYQLRQQQLRTLAATSPLKLVPGCHALQPAIS